MLATWINIWLLVTFAIILTWLCIAGVVAHFEIVVKRLIDFWYQRREQYFEDITKKGLETDKRFN